MRRWSLGALIVWTLVGCSGDDGPGPGDLPGDPAGELASDPGLHALTSATPGVESAVLGEDHPGRAHADCLACHVPTHGGLRPPDCVACHGMNGTPALAAGHPSSGCAGCHASAHAAVAPPFQAPADCRSCHRYPGTEACAAVEEYDAVVIGAGGGGLGAAAALARAGWKVAVVERHNKVGGYMTSFRRGDFRFEVSLHAMGGFDDASPGTRGMFAELGILDRVQPVKARAMYRTHFPDQVVEVPGEVDAWRDRLKAAFPAEAEGLDRFFHDVPEIQEVLAAYLAGQDEFNALMARKPAAVGRFMEWAYGNLGDAVRSYVSDPKLFAMLTGLSSYVGVEPDNLSALYFFMMWNSYHLGGFYNFIGGSQSVSDALAGVVLEAGGRILLNTAATRIVVQDGRAVEVRTDGGPCLRARWFVSNANPFQTVQLVGRGNLPADWLARIDGGTPGWSLVVVYVGTDRDYTPEFGDVHEVLLQGSWDTTQAYRSAAGCDADESVLLIANYSVLDATAAPAGKNAISITGTLSADCEDGWHWGDHGAYRSMKDAVAARFLARAERVLPDLRDHVVAYEVAGPQTLEGFTLNPRGTIYGWHQSPEQSLLERLPQQTPIPNLLLAGAWTFPGCGQSAVIQSGHSAARKILAADEAR